MEGAGTENSAQGLEAGRPHAWIDLRLIVLLLLVASAVRAWVITHTEVPARDTIGYIRYAWQLEHQPWAEVMRHSERHPGYPVSIYLVSLPLRHLVSGPDALTMQLSAQVASSIAGVLLVIPMFLLGRAIFDRTVGFWSALLFQCLPESGLVLSDGLSEGMFLLFAATALLVAVHALSSDAPWRFALCGLFGALAFLTRPEGGLIVAITGLVLLGSQAVRGWRRPWSKALRCGGSLAIVAVLTASPFFLTIGAPTTQPSSMRVIGDFFQVIKNVVLKGRPETPAGPVSLQSTGSPLDAESAVNRPLFASAFAVWWPNPDDPPSKRVGWGMRALALETIKAFHYTTWLPALLGLWWFRDRLRKMPGVWVMLILCGLLALALWRIAVVVGYMSDRHALLIVMCGTFWGVAGIQLIGQQLADLGRRIWTRPLFRRVPMLGGDLQPGSNARFCSAMLVIGLVASGLPKTLEPLHADRAGHRTAGLWLAEHTEASDFVVDPFCWAHYYAGRMFLEGLTTVGPPHHQYVVLERSKNAHSHLVTLSEAERKAQGGTEVFRCPLRRSRDGDKAEIVVYSVKP